MTSLERAEQLQERLLWRSFLIAASVFLAVAMMFGLRSSLTSSHPPSASSSPLLEAELVPFEEKPQLHETTAPAHAAKVEATVSTKLSEKSGPNQSLDKVVAAENQTTAAPPPLPSHGPVVTYSNSPKIPSYLKNEIFKTSVLIEFNVRADGSAQPSLIGSSGNEELDAIAIQSAKTWVFQPAAKDGKPTDSKVRLRINFAVE